MLSTRFIKTAVKPKDYPIIRNSHGQLLPEVAVAGRSNVGKSSLLNDLFRTPGLVKTSSVPGKTQTLNFFIFDDRLAFADLPGYGYAHVPLSVKKQWGPMVQDYLKTRASLALILFLLDIRRDPNLDDLQFLEWASFQQISTIVVLTKLDKIKKSEQEMRVKKILTALEAGNIHYVLYSTVKKQGRQQLLHMMKEAVEEAVSAKKQEDKGSLHGFD